MSDGILAWGLGQLTDTIDQWAKRNQNADLAARRAAIVRKAYADAGDDGAAQAQPPADATGTASTAAPSFAGPGSTAPASQGPAGASPQDASAPAPKLPSIAAVQGTPTGTGIGAMLTGLNDQHRLPSGFLTRTAGIESNFNVNAYNKGSGAAGPFQFVPSTAAAYGLGNPYDWRDSAMAAARLASDNAATLRNALGRDPTGGELYLAHQQGAGGAAKLLANPNARAGDIVGDAAVRSNGGDPNMPARLFAAKWISRYDGGGTQAAQTAQASAPTPGLGYAGPATPMADAPGQRAITAATGGQPSPSPLASVFGGLTGADPSTMSAPAPSPGDLAPSAPAAPARPPLFTMLGQPGGGGDDAQGGGSSSPLGTALGYAPSTNHGQGGFPDTSFPTKRVAPPTASLNGGQSPPPRTPAGGLVPVASATGDPEVPVPGYAGTWSRAKVAAAPDGIDVPDDGELARAQQSAAGGTGTPALPQPGPQAASPRALSPIGGGAVPVSPRNASGLKNAILAMVADPDLSDEGMKLWAQAATGKNYGWQHDETNGLLIRTSNDGGPPVAYQIGNPKPISVSAGTSLVDPRDPTKAFYTAPTADKAADKGFRVVQIGEDQFGRKRYGRLNQSTGQVTPVEDQEAPGGQAAAGPQPVSDLHGEDFLATLDPQIAGQVKAIVEGRAPYPTGMLLKTPYGQQLATYVTQADPTFETGNATSRVKVRNEFNSGGPSSPAGMITAGNTAIQHLGHLSDAAEALGNTWSPDWNRLANATAQRFGSGTAVTQFNNILGKYVEEATKFYRGTGGTEADIQRDLGNLSPNMSPAQLRTALQTQVELLQSKINALQDRWHQGMGPTLGDFPIVQPDSQGALAKIAKRAGVAPSNAAQNGGAPAAPAPAAAQQGGRVQVRGVADYNALPSGTRYLDPNGTARIKP